MTRWYQSEGWEGGPLVWIPRAAFSAADWASLEVLEPCRIFEMLGEPDVGDTLPMWTVYKNPVDIPAPYVARLSKAGRGQVVMTLTVLTADSLDEIRAKVQDACPGCERLEKGPDDDPKIVEIWT